MNSERIPIYLLSPEIFPDFSNDVEMKKRRRFTVEYKDRYSLRSKGFSIRFCGVETKVSKRKRDLRQHLLPALAL